MSIENVIIIRNKTQLEKLQAKFNTRQQAKFYIEQNQLNYAQSVSKSKKKQRKKSISSLGTNLFTDIERAHGNFYDSLERIQKRLSSNVKTKVVDREFLSNYIFSNNDMVLVIGQDGLVANTAKYIDDIPIVAVNPDPERFDGTLLPFNIHNFEDAVLKVVEGKYDFKSVTMAEAKLNDGQRLLAFNDLFIGPKSHSSARYQISWSGRTENHSSSGVIVSTGAGSTGWLSSVFNMANGIVSAFQEQTMEEAVSEEAELQEVMQMAEAGSPGQTLPWDTDHLLFVVREPFRSKTSQIQLTTGMIQRDQPLILESFMNNKGVIFSDGIESDFLRFDSGTIAEIGIAKERARLVVP